MFKRKCSTDSESSAKTPRMGNISTYKYVKLSDILPDYENILTQESSEGELPFRDDISGTDDLSFVESGPLLAIADGKTQGVFLPSAFLESLAENLESLVSQISDDKIQRLQEVIQKIISYKPYDQELDTAEETSRKSSLDSIDIMNRCLIRPEFESSTLDSRDQSVNYSNEDTLHEICEQYVAVMGMRPQLTTTESSLLPHEPHIPKEHEKPPSHPDQMSPNEPVRTRRGSSAGQKGIYGSYARKIEALQRANIEDIKNIKEATSYKPPDCPNKPENNDLYDDLAIKNTFQPQIDSGPIQAPISRTAHQYSMVTPGVVQAVPIMHAGGFQYFIQVPVAPGPYMPQTEVENAQNANYKCTQANNTFAYPQMQFLQINPFANQPQPINKVPGNPSTCENRDSVMPNSAD